MIYRKTCGDSPLTWTFHFVLSPSSYSLIRRTRYFAKQYYHRYCFTFCYRPVSLLRASIAAEAEPNQPAATTLNLNEWICDRYKLVQSTCNSAVNVSHCDIPLRQCTLDGKQQHHLRRRLSFLCIRPGVVENVEEYLDSHQQQLLFIHTMNVRVEPKRMSRCYVAVEEAVWNGCAREHTYTNLCLPGSLYIQNIQRS